jgi:acetyltransferase EpsM
MRDTPMRVLFLGAGGHGQVIADALLCCREAGENVCPIGFLDDNAALLGTTRVGLPVLGPIASLAQTDHDAVVVGIGDNGVRRMLFDRCLAAGERLASVCHPRAIVAREVTIGPGTVICAGVVVNIGARIGANCILNTASSVDHHCIIEDHVHIAPGTRLGGDVTIGEGTLVGIGAVVLPQRRVGAWSIVGGGAVVTRNLPGRVVAYGSPARVAHRETES